MSLVAEPWFLQTSTVGSFFREMNALNHPISPAPPLRSIKAAWFAEPPYCIYLLYFLCYSLQIVLGIDRDRPNIFNLPILFPSASYFHAQVPACYLLNRQ